MVTIAAEKDLDALVAMGLDLWPEQDAQRLQSIFTGLLHAPEKNHIHLFSVHGEVAGFIYTSIRVDYVDGSETSPVGYVEGIYVKPEYRRRGISAQLLKAGEQWAKEKGCREMGSDILADNTVSYAFHTAIGFREASRLITFIKKIE